MASRSAVQESPLGRLESPSRTNYDGNMVRVVVTCMGAMKKSVYKHERRMSGVVVSGT
jgi:hypothetical protein